jgi:hypothetical protein
MRVTPGDGRRKTTTKLALREETRPTQRSQQQSPGDALYLLLSFGVHSHVPIYTTPPRGLRRAPCR